MLLLDKGKVSDPVMTYLMSIQPKYQKTPLEGPYSHAFIIGSEKMIPFSAQGTIDEMLEIVSASGKGHMGM